MEVIGRGNIVKNRIGKGGIEFARKVFGIRLRGMINASTRFDKFDKLARIQLIELKARYEAMDARQKSEGASASSLWTVTESMQQ